MSATQFRVNEKTTARYTAQLVDETGAGIPAASLATLTLTLYDVATSGIINSRSAQNVLNVNGVTVDTSGNLVWTMDPLDNAVIGSRELEAHVALFEYTYGSKGGKHEVSLLVANLQKVT